ncbi:gliding motility-associated C-terminal domain-containing protein [Sungkyunkwania multivorans]|uniref:Gliding motility-associated C-terminal domain-containing protein n=1 Tax=Sungkyunkwania multivorans TaxID=1173618 RepID=A0ABW3D244_9FLAO
MTKTVRVAGSALNDVIEYDIIVTNTGNVTLTDIEVTDANADAGSIVGSPIASLDPGQSATVTAQQTIQQSDLDAGYIENSATATGDSPDGTDDVSDVSDTDVDGNGDPIPDNENTETDDGDGTSDGDPTNDPTVTTLGPPPMPSLRLVKTAAFDGVGEVGETILYTFTVTNTGNTTVSNLTITDAVIGISNLAVTPSTLAPNEIGIATVSYSLTSTDVSNGTVVNSAVVNGDSDSGGTVSDVSDNGDENEDEDGDGDGGNDPTIVVFDLDPITGVSPDDDGENDTFQIPGIENFPNNTVRIYNRWGVLVYETRGYGQNGNVFRGISNGRVTINTDATLPEGTYYYVLEYQLPNGTFRSKAGYLYINR